MSESFLLIGQWGNRVETVESVTHRFSHLLMTLGSIDRLWSRWLFLREGETKPVDLLDKSALEREVEAVREDWLPQGQEEPVEYALHVVSDNDDCASDSDVLMFVGAVSDSMPILNNVSCHLPRLWSESTGGLTRQKASRILAAFAVAWDADWVSINAQKAMAQAPYTLRGPLVGLATYLAPWRSPLPPLPDYAQVEMVEGGAHIVTLDEAFLNRPSEEYARRGQEVWEVLHRANVLLPTPFWPDDDPIAFAEKVHLAEEEFARREAVAREALEERNRNLGLPPPQRLE